MFKLLYTKSLCLSTESRVVCKSHTRLYSGRTVGERDQVGEEVVEAPLELAPRVEQVTRGRLQLRLAREAPGEVRQRDADAVDVAIREQPLLIADEHAPEGGDAGVAVGEGVDSPMVPDSLGDGIAAANRSLDEVAGEIADERLGRVAGEEEVGEVVHSKPIVPSGC